MLAVLVGATAALWCSWQLLHRMKRRWWLLTIPALLVAAYLALWTVGQGVAASFPGHSSARVTHTRETSGCGTSR